MKKVLTKEKIVLILIMIYALANTIGISIMKLYPENVYGILFLMTLYALIPPLKE